MESVNDSSGKFCGIVKILSGLLCITGFALNSLAMTKQFFSGKTVMSGDVKPYESLLLPPILICNKTPYKTDDLSQILKNYTANTLQLEDFLIDATVYQTGAEPFTHQNTSRSGITVKDQVTAVYTAFYGKCYLLHPNIKVYTA